MLALIYAIAGESTEAQRLSARHPQAFWWTNTVVSSNVCSVSANVALHQKSGITLTLQCSPLCPYMTVTDVRSCKWLVFCGGDDFVGLVAPLVSPHHADWSTCLFLLVWYGRTPPYSSEVSFDSLLSGFLDILIANDLSHRQLDVA